jgi:hypothetical protein
MAVLARRLLLISLLKERRRQIGEAAGYKGRGTALRGGNPPAALGLKTFIQYYLLNEKKALPGESR